MEHNPQTKHPLRCFCARQPLLAYYGVDHEGSLYIHTKSYKQKKLYSEAVFLGGILRIRCRDCFRWHKIIFKDTSASMEEVPAPHGV